MLAEKWRSGFGGAADEVREKTGDVPPEGVRESIGGECAEEAGGVFMAVRYVAINSKPRE